MASSPVQICNIALVALGANTILNLSEDSIAAIACNTHYQDSLKATLGAAHWTFATKRASLPVLAAAPEFGFLAAYLLPPDNLHVQEAYAADGITALDIPWVVEDGKILTDQAAPLLIKYTYNNQETPTYPTLFIDALVARVASDLALPVTRQLPLRTQWLETFLEKVSIAATIDSQQGSDDAFESNMLTDVRT